MNKKEFGEELARIRERYGMSQSGLASALGVSEQQFADWEDGKELPSNEQMQAIADALGIPVGSLTAALYKPRVSFRGMDEESEEEKKRMIAEYESASEERYFKGRKIVRWIVIIESILTALSFILRLALNPVTAFISLALSIIIIVCLWRGHPWARILFIALGIWGVFFDVIYVFSMSNIPSSFMISFMINVAYRITACVLLFANKSVEEFLYSQYTD